MDESLSLINLRGVEELVPKDLTEGARTKKSSALQFCVLIFSMMFLTKNSAIRKAFPTYHLTLAGEDADEDEGADEEDDDDDDDEDEDDDKDDDEDDDEEDDEDDEARFAEIR